MVLLLEGLGVSGAAVTLSPAALMADVTLNDVRIVQVPC